MSGPLLLFMLTGLAAAASALLRRRPVAASVLAAGSSLAITALVMFAPIDEPQAFLGIPLKLEGRWMVLGRSFLLHEGNRAHIGFIYLVGGLFFIAAWAALPGWHFQSIGLLIQAMLAASLLVDPFLFAAIFLEFAAMGGVLILASSAPRASSGSPQLLILYTFAMMAILMTGWLLENVGVTSVTEQLASRVLMLLALGFSILMFLPPFHFWLPSAAEHGNPFALANVALLLQSAGVFLLLRFLDTYAWIRLTPRIFQWLRIAGATMVVYGAFAAAAQRTLRRVVAYALLPSFGVVLIAIGLGSDDGYRLSLELSGAGVLSTALAALGASTLLLGDTGLPGREALIGSGRRRPLAMAACVLGLLGLSGFPLTPGFAGRWALLVSSTAPEAPIGGAVLISTVLVALTAFRWATRMLTPSKGPHPEELNVARRAMLGCGLALSTAVAFFPQLVSPWVDIAVQGLTNLIP